MPSSSHKQAMFMSAVAHSPEFAKKAGVPQKVGREFHEADVGKRDKSGKRHLVKALRSRSTGGTTSGTAIGGGASGGGAG
jgi:hypothetical protein